jgi:hypothetical protein
MKADHSTRTEWDFLRALCEAGLPAPVRMEFCSRLPPQKMAEIENRVIFQEICALTIAGHPATSRDLREQLAARVTARGFPDLDFDNLFYSEKLSPEDASARVKKYFLRVSSQTGPVQKADS